MDYLRQSTLSWLVPVVLVAASLASYSVIQVHRQQSAFLIEQARHISNEIELDLQRRQHGLKSIAALASADEPIMDHARWYRLARAYDLVFGTPVVLAADDRRILFNTRAPLGEALGDLPKPPGRAALKEALITGDPQVGDVVFAPVLGRKVVTVIAPITKNYALLGLVVLPDFEELLARQAMPAGWTVSVFDGVGSLVASTAEDPLDSRAETSARRSVMLSTAMPMTVVVEADRWSFYRPHVEAGLILLVCVSLAFFGGAYATNKASRGVLASLRRMLARQSSSGARRWGDDSPVAARIAEIEAAGIELHRQSRNRYQMEEAARAQIARDLHDGLQQDATAAVVHLQVMKSQMDPSSALHKAATSALECSQRVITGLSTIVKALRPASVVAGGLSSALQTYTEQFSDITGVHAEVDVLGEDSQVESLPKPAVDCLYRVAQECLNNVRKHADASIVHIEIDVRSTAQVRMTVMDDGVGSPGEVGSERAGSGLQNITDRVGALMGTVEVSTGHDRSRQHGTTVTVRLPLVTT